LRRFDFAVIGIGIGAGIGFYGGAGLLFGGVNNRLSGVVNCRWKMPGLCCECSDAEANRSWAMVFLLPRCDEYKLM
jgi:hypothetical protein